MSKEKAFEEWQCYDTELGSSHPDTLDAKRKYFELCKEQQDSRELSATS